MLEAYIITSKLTSPINLYEEGNWLYSNFNDVRDNLNDFKPNFYIAKIRISDKQVILDCISNLINENSLKDRKLYADIVETYSITKNEALL